MGSTKFGSTFICFHIAAIKHFSHNLNSNGIVRFMMKSSLKAKNTTKKPVELGTVTAGADEKDATL